MRISLNKELLLLILLPLLAGCNPHLVAKEIHPLVDGGDTFLLKVEGIDPQNRWWEALNDRRLDALIVEVLSENLTLRQARARIDQATADERQSGSFLFPEVTGETSVEGVGTIDKKTDYRYNASAGLSWEIDLWGRLSSVRKSAEYEVLVSRDGLEATAILLTAQLAETYFQIIEQRLQLALLEHQIEAGETFLELIELRFGYGTVSVVDVYQQRQQLASIHAQAPIVQSQLRTLKNQEEPIQQRFSSPSFPKTNVTYPPGSLVFSGERR